VAAGGGVSRSAIGLMSYAALAFTFKFAWAPFIDEYDAPLVSAWLGRRRGWMLIAQLGVAAGLPGLAFGAPAESLGWSVAFAFLTAFAAASQDVTIDGWRIDAAPIERQGMMSAVWLSPRDALRPGRSALHRGFRQLARSLSRDGGADADRDRRLCPVSTAR
jgi:hypothetical protein